MTASHFQKTGYVACGAYECRAVLDDTPEARTTHLRTTHPDLIGTIYLPCDPPEEATCSSTGEDPPTSPDPAAPQGPAAT